MRNFREYDIWQDSMEIVKRIYILSESFPKNEQFILVQQMLKSAISIPSNIAEGSAKNSESDFARFLEIALGSCFELETQILLASNLGYIKEAQSLIEEMNSLEKRISGLIKTLRKK